MTNKIKKLTLKGKAKIIESDDGVFVEKKKEKDLKELFEYLSIRDVNLYPEIIEETDTTLRFKYYEERKYQIDNIESRIAESVADMHYKTTYFKDVSRKKYKDIYNTLIDNLDYLKEYYNDLITKIDLETYLSPSDYLLGRNYSIILADLAYIEKELNSWYNIVKDKTKERVSVVHNNIKKENIRVSDKLILTGWEHYLVDTPILDIYKMYKNEYKNMDFTNILKTYNEKFPLTKEESKLLFIMISMPKKIERKNNEYERVSEVKKLLDYIYRTNLIVKSGIFN